MKNKDITEKFYDFCASKGIKRTVQRYAVFSAIYENHTHPSVDAIFMEVKKSLPMIKPESVYRILNDFHAAGLIEKLGIPGIMRYDYNTTTHGHFLCMRCGKIVDVPAPKIDLPENLKKAGNISVVINGLCPSCSKSAKLS